MHITLTPAYVRDYRSKAAVREALLADMLQPTGQYISGGRV